MRAAAAEASAAARPDMLDRNGEVLATDIKTMSIFAEPRRIIDKDEATELLTAVLPDVDPKELRDRLGSRKGFVWVKREITPKQQQEVYRLGCPASASGRKTSASIRTARSARMCWARRTSTTRA